MTECKKFICEKCNFQSKYIQNYKRHLQTGSHKTGKRSDYKEPYKCPDCYYETKNISNYNFHILSNHSSEEQKEHGFVFYCKDCKIGTNTESQYIKHKLSKKHNKIVNYNNGKT